MAEGRTIRTEVYLVEHEMPGGLPGTRGYNCGRPLHRTPPGSRRTLMGTIAGPYGPGAFVLAHLLEMAIAGEDGMSWHPCGEGSDG